MLLLLAGAAAVVALPPGETAAPSTSREEELEAIRAEIALLQQRLEDLRERENDLESRLARIDLRVELQERRIAEAVAAREVAGERAAKAEAAVVRLEDDLAGARRDLRRRLAGLYRFGHQGYLRLLLAAEPGSDVLSAVRLIRFLARRDRDAIQRYESVREELSAERDELLDRREEVEAWRRQEEARGRDLAALRRRHQELLAAVEAERRDLAAQAVELAEKEQKLAALLDRLFGRSAAPLAGTPMQDFRGVLDWPAVGEISEGFGPRLDPRYRTQVPHNGIDIATRPGAEVRAVYPGKVLFAAPFQGYGPTAVVHHAGRVFTLYAGLAELKVEAEDMLSLGQVLGRASDRLYFEIRVENRPEDPVDWLR